jgi:hypothetical protein
VRHSSISRVLAFFYLISFNKRCLLRCASESVGLSSIALLKDLIAKLYLPNPAKASPLL